MTPAFIAVDWGTSNFRAFLADAEARVLAERRSAAGLRALEAAAFPHYCREQLSDWLHDAGGEGALPIYLAGMVGARSGWAEAAQLELPLSPETLAAHLTAAPGLANAWLVPGGKVVTAEHVDVMRGEEVQAFGGLALTGRDSGLFCLPGTHSKWIRAEGGRLVDFTTLVTGELYHAVRFHTLLGEPVPPEDAFDAEGFERGLAAARHPAGVLHALFEARSRYLHDGLAAGQVGSFLSGVLIGSEIAAMDHLLAPANGVTLIGSPALAARYRQALGGRRDLVVTTLDSDVASLAGIARLHARRRAASA
ncbi:2-dehydro-3-deoxygalactonokinase [Halomonas sp. NO4]|uniref:2-dehydro-3-deoxygalactonokinase n=1 Tax=Halomonas sp. NO4 TaxID=2484813 RepID=UPI0013D1CF10|nr:2-dehydro-3-deoxygalactonokinase [Halomonas sp. NO4]